jgi:branched-chain amino acid aminotransferase
VSEYLNFNGSLIAASEKIIGASNRGFRYGDGLFETIKVVNGKILLWDFHAERLFAGMKLLQFNIPGFITKENIAAQLLELCKKNRYENAKGRLVVFRGDGGLYHVKDHSPNYIIEASEIANPLLSWNENGLRMTVFPDGRKSVDRFSNLKSNNFLIYAMAAFHAEKNGFDDCLILNAYEHACESTKANIFCVINGSIFTPPLSEGCVAGVMRRYVIEKLMHERYNLFEKKLTVEEIENADEIFLSNAIDNVQWIQYFDEKQYGNTFSKKIFQLLQKNLY